MSSPRFSTIQLATGPRLHYAAQGPPDGVPILFLHGWPDSWFSFSRVLPLLPAQLRLLVPDQCGFGDSDRPNRTYAIDDYAADAIAFLDALSIDRAVVVGHSFGSFVTRRVALTHPERVAKMVLIGTAVSAGTPVVRAVQGSLATLNDPVPEAFAREFQAGTAHVPLPPAFFDRIIAESMKLPARLWREALDAVLAYNDVGQMGRIAAPTLLLWGEHDALFPRADQERLNAEIRGSTLTIYEDTGHCPNWERPERVAADLLAFVES